MTLAINIKNLSKTFDRVKVLKNVSIQISKGEIVALIGPSGSGKSTLIRHIAGLKISDKTISGSTDITANTEILINGKLLQSNGKLGKSVRKIRSGIGVIFQQFNLINRLSVLTNVLIGSLGKIPSWRGSIGYFTRDEKIKAMQALDSVGLKDFAFQRASNLSGGQQQRVAIARTLMQDVNIILADEPIASLDPKSAKMVMESLQEIGEKQGKTLVITLHQVEYARKYCHRVIALVDGRVAFDSRIEDLSNEVLQKLYGTNFKDAGDGAELSATTPFYSPQTEKAVA